LAAARSDAALALCNPSPVDGVDAEVVRSFDVAIVNEIEHQQLAAALPDRVVVTLGARGALLLPERIQIAGLPVAAVDATGAGDAFAGVFAAALAQGLESREAARLANIAAGLSVRTPGAQPSYAVRDEIVDFAEGVTQQHE
jgi:ribokinase